MSCCHNSTRCPLPSPSAVTVITYLFQQSPAVSLHLQVSPPVPITSFTSPDNPPFFYLLSTSYLLFTQLSPQPSHFLFLCLTLSDTPISSVLCRHLQDNISPTFVIQGDLQPGVLSVLKDVRGHFVYFQVRHGVRDVTHDRDTLLQCPCLTMCRQCAGIWG